VTPHLEVSSETLTSDFFALRESAFMKPVGVFELNLAATKNDFPHYFFDLF
jgi:hypothetical protein